MKRGTTVRTINGTEQSSVPDGYIGWIVDQLPVGESLSLLSEWRVLFPMCLCEFSKDGAWRISSHRLEIVT